MRKIEKIEKCQRTSKSTLNKNRRKGRMESMLKNKAEQGITLVALVITIVLNCCRSGRNHIKETNLKNILEKRINLL